MDTFSSWFASFASCCGPRERSGSTESSRRLVSNRTPNLVGAERNIVVLRDQPAVIPRPSAEPAWSSERTYEKTLDREAERTRLRRPASRDSSVRKNWFSGSSSSVRRLQISGPTDFRHLQSESFQFPPQETRPRPRSFRPIELSIYQPDNRLSAILPHVDCEITHPPRAYTGNSSKWDASSSSTLTNERGHHQTMSFHIPRKHRRQESGMSEGSMSPPRIPPKSRARASTAPNTERIVARIASAMIEKERLQAEINSVVQRQSAYFGNRPLTGFDMGGALQSASHARAQLTSTDIEPMPSIPALPAAAPSFAQRLSLDDRPRIAPSRVASMTVQEKTLSLTAAAQSQPPQPSFFASARRRASSPEKGSERLERPLAPPLPLVLRPPLRKKKSFSRVSHWLFNPDESDEIPQSADTTTPTTMTFGTTTATTAPTTTTTSPRPIKESDGFYQCVAPPEGLPRTSMETSSSVYTWETGGDDDEGDESASDGGAKTLPTTTAAWSPDQTPKQGSSTRHTTPVIGFDKAEFQREIAASGGGGGDGLGVVNPYVNGPRPMSVGVAF
ncbi:hypothetical protein CHGG_03881 [Chaetomium globosum CBS 148.51]|uniref:Uncharacterized protein n=1 Tax=Chaetomium globosum (strain ATCC 6205 / CBS 148.51 / DSM 1962 / NBRC 6347 / NRRL 1970) TaxID=306901 RepID=Q2H2W5_CHAGB|nr:uncharacterized protein CHGG_03881 [Chaetomium globosum CBS 148.51]EAQ87262.1 hypothetical protein CHGG_03881 [Chaetomium globosum CBS 148.51]